jgi:serine protease DegQ
MPQGYAGNSAAKSTVSCYCEATTPGTAEMKRAPLYSGSTRQPPAATPKRVEAPVAEPAAAPAVASMAPARRAWRRQTAWLAAIAVLLAAAWAYTPRLLPKPLTQKDIDAAVLHTLSKHPLPQPATKAAEAIAPSLVRVMGLHTDADTPAGDTAKDEDEDRDVGSGVVITERGVILTNLHVVAGAKRIKVMFHDGLEADASLINLMPEHDLAVLQAKKLPDDLQPATMRSTGDLKPGDRVTAIGFPFGIGPSVSHGVVSGLKREFRSPEGKRVLTNLIQFDAAANPGNSGGPLVTDDGEVVGIVTAILNPTQQRFFVGIGFAVPIENAAAGAGLPPF